MMQGSLAWNWRTDILCFHLLFLFVSFAQFNNKFSQSVTHSSRVTLCYCFPFSFMLNFFTYHRVSGADDWSNILFMTPGTCMSASGRLNPCDWRKKTFLWHATKICPGEWVITGVLGKDCQQKWISVQEDTTQATVQWFTMSWQLFPTTTFQTLLCMTLSLK